MSEDTKTRLGGLFYLVLAMVVLSVFLYFTRNIVVTRDNEWWAVPSVIVLIAYEVLSLFAGLSLVLQGEK